MALHRKQRGAADALPQYVRLPTARAAYSAVATATRAAPRKSRKPREAPRAQMSSLQLRACFLLCVALYFGTIYFADSIVGIGRALGSEPVRGHDFFVQAAPANLRVADDGAGEGGGDDGKADKYADAPEAEEDTRRGGEEPAAQVDAETVAQEETREDLPALLQKGGEETAAATAAVEGDARHEIQGAPDAKEQQHNPVEVEADKGENEVAAPPGEAHVAVPIAQEPKIKERSPASPAAAADAPELASPRENDGTLPFAAPTQRVEADAPAATAAQHPEAAVQAVQQDVEPGQGEAAAKPTALVNRPEEVRDEHR